MRRIYLDHAATTPLDERVLDVMVPYLREHYGNASSVHALGRKARFAVEECREKMAALLGAAPAEVVFTSGGTEANNAALKGIVRGGRQHLITSAVEHEAVLRPAESLQAAGYLVTKLKPEESGAVTAAQVTASITEHTGLVSLMHANNELGTLNPVREIAAVCHSRNVPFHCDAVQTAGLLHLQVDALGVDLLTLSSHKFYGPKGVGVLYIRSGIDFRPLIEGGAQERRRRGGTENVAAIVGMVDAFERACAGSAERVTHLTRLRDHLVQRLASDLDTEYVMNTPSADVADVAPHIINLSFPPVGGHAIDGEMLLLNLDLEGIAVSAGSACTSGALEPSHVLLAIGRDRETASASVRFSLGKDNTVEDIDEAVETLGRVLQRMGRRPDMISKSTVA